MENYQDYILSPNGFPKDSVKAMRRFDDGEWVMIKQDDDVEYYSNVSSYEIRQLFQSFDGYVKGGIWILLE